MLRTKGWYGLTAFGKAVKQQSCPIDCARARDGGGSLHFLHEQRRGASAQRRLRLMRIRPVAVVKSPLPVHMRHQAPKPPTRLRELLSGRERLQARGGADCEDLPHDVCGHDSVEGYVQPMLPAGGSSLLGELRPWPRRVAASVVCAACILVALWLVVGLQLADAPIITPEVRRALSIMWVEGLEGGLSGAAAMVRVFRVPASQGVMRVASVPRPAHAHACANRPPTHLRTDESERRWCKC